MEYGKLSRVIVYQQELLQVKDWIDHKDTLLCQKHLCIRTVPI